MPGQASSSRLAVEKADALVNAGLAAKTLEDKLRTAAASLDKLGGEATKLAEQRSRLEAAFVASRGHSFLVGVCFFAHGPAFFVLSFFFDVRASDKPRAHAHTHTHVL